MDRNFLNKIVKNNERYKKFTLLSTPTPFNVLNKDIDVDVVQLHSISPCGDDDIVGFCGVCSWKNNTLSSLDHDSYYNDMLVYGYSWFKDDELNKCLDILVEDW